MAQTKAIRRAALIRNTFQANDFMGFEGLAQNVHF